MKTFDQLKKGDRVWLSSKNSATISCIHPRKDGTVNIFYDILRPALNQWDIDQHEENDKDTVVRVKTDTSDEEKVFIKETRHATIGKKDLNRSASEDRLFACKEAAINHEVTVLQYYNKCLENEIEAKKQQILKYSERILALLEEKASCKA